MVRRLPFRLHRVVPGLTVALSLALLACSGGGNATAPDPDVPNDPPHAPGPQQPPPAPGPDQPPPGPGPDQPPPPPPPPAPDFNVTGNYGLTKINDSEPGQMVLLSNPDGSAIGLYRFDAGSALAMTDQQTWAFVIVLEDEKNVYQIQNQGTFTRSGERGRGLTFESTLDGKVFSGVTKEGILGFSYDLDGDGAPDTELTFVRN